MQIVKIGKSRSNDIYKDFVNDSTVSRFHCQLFVDDEGNTFLTDLESTNGTFVNGNKIVKPVKLDSLDIVRAGNSLVKWKEYLMNKNVVSSSLSNNTNYKDDDFVSFFKNYWWVILIIMILFICLCLLIYFSYAEVENLMRSL